MSVNRLLVELVRAAIDPTHAGSEVERVRERLARAGLLDPPGLTPDGRRPSRAQVAGARRASHGGAPSGADLVSEGRGPK